MHRIELYIQEASLGRAVRNWGRRKFSVEAGNYIKQVKNPKKWRRDLVLYDKAEGLGKTLHNPKKELKPVLKKLGKKISRPVIMTRRYGL